MRTILPARHHIDDLNHSVLLLESLAHPVPLRHNSHRVRNILIYWDRYGRPYEAKLTRCAPLVPRAAATSILPLTVTG